MGSVVEIADVQSLVFSSHLKLPHTVAAWLRVRDVVAARATLREVVVDAVSFGIPAPARTSAVQLLLTAGGLRSLGALEPDVGQLDRPFLQGITATHRSRALGDAGRNDPRGWWWNDRTADALIVAYAADPSAAERGCEDLLRRLEAGWSCPSRVNVRLPEGGREHFGFRDGLVHTRIDIGDGSPAESGADLLPAGEVLCGYRNALGLVEAVSPLARNGTYVVVRQLEQDVRGFWTFFREQGGSEEAAVWLAAKAMGRWPNGMPVSGPYPMPEPTYDEDEATRLLSFRDDPHGDHCPLGAHIRRANPRDGLGPDPKRSLVASSQHRILRRGRVYGPSAPPEWLPGVVGNRRVVASDDAANRGLFFVALCNDLARQFEFIQQTWLNNPKHSGRFDEVDPVAAGEGIVGDGERFSIPREPVRLRLAGVRRWVTVRGGGYYLLPSRRVLTGLLS